VHENARYVPASVKLLAERLHDAGYRTSAFVSSFALAKRFGLARGFDVYDETFSGSAGERSSRETTDAAIADLASGGGTPRFMWVHYYDPHAPYAPPEPYRSRFAREPYLGEIAAMDEQLGRLVNAFEKQINGPAAIVVAADHGEGLGDHGEAQHGRLLYQSTMHVPLVVVGPGVSAGVDDRPAGTRRIFFTILDWAGLGGASSLRGAPEQVVLGEAMKPFLEYGWQPQVMAVAERYKAISAGKVETFDVVADPQEARNLGAGASVPMAMQKELGEYPAPSPDAARPPDNLDAEAKRRLAALGYVGAGAAPIVRKDAPRPIDMTPLFATMDLASGLFTDGEYAKAIPVLQKILAADPHNLDAQLRLATAYSSLGHDDLAVAAFQTAAELAPASQDVRTYLGLHYARTKEWRRAVPLLEQVVRESPDRLTAVEALGALKAKEGAAAIEEGNTTAAMAALERARQLQGAGFRHDLDMGVVYLAARRFEDARAALDRALAVTPGDPMALFKRAQVSVLLREPDAAARIALARQKADVTTRPLIERETLFHRSR
jgi:Flp pilus assembly protein TadD